MRARWAALVAAAVLALVAGLSLHGAVEDRPARQVGTVAAESPSGSLAASPETSGPAVTAVEPGRAVVLVRSEGRQTSVALVAAHLAVGLVGAAAPGRRGRRQLLELVIRSQTEWWLPAPGGRAPPRALPL